jgi:undecaprenyl-phosphate galactose phosphotransferase/putative colanic acid biosynthesis UDP-glucose lipid carrier transferase
MSATSRNAKRLLDIALAGAGLVASAPLWAIIAALIKAEAAGGVPDAGTGVPRRPAFRALKFRSMVPDAEARVGPVQVGRTTRV